MTTIDDAKCAAGVEVARLVEDGMIVGLGTGSTAAPAIRELGRRVRDEGLHITGTPTSFASEILAREVGIPLCDLSEIDAIDIAFDGADEVDPNIDVIKGRGAAQTREKVVASLARRFIILVDESKLVDRLGAQMPLPIEVIPMASFPIKRKLEGLGAEVSLRMGQRKDGPVVTDQGLWILDANFKPAISNPEELDHLLLTTPGVLDHGLFLGLATDVFVGKADGSVEHRQR